MLHEVKEKIKEKINNNKVVLAVSTATAGATLSPVACFASGDTGTANTAVVSAMQGVANDMIATAESIIPTALSVIGLALVVVFGVSIFKRIASRA